MKCNFVSYTKLNRNVDPPTERSITRCTVHHWVFDGGVPAELLCPIGRIEQATDEAIERIRRASHGHQQM